MDFTPETRILPEDNFSLKILSCFPQMTTISVSYTHLDVYKRQTEGRVGGAIEFVSAFDGWQSTTPSELVVVQCPTMEDAKASGLLVRPSQLFGVSKNSAHQDVALDFVQFMMSDPDGVKAPVSYTHLIRRMQSSVSPTMGPAPMSTSSQQKISPAASAKAQV